jgi:phage shock protein A
MAIHILRRSPETATPARHQPKPAARETDPALLLPEIRAGLYTLDHLLDELGQREQHLLADAAACYDQLTAVARKLDEVRRQLTNAAEQASTLREAEQLLVAAHTPARAGEHGDSPRSDTLAVQP